MRSSSRLLSATFGCKVSAPEHFIIVEHCDDIQNSCDNQQSSSLKAAFRFENLAGAVLPSWRCVEPPEEKLFFVEICISFKIRGNMFFVQRQLINRANMHSKSKKVCKSLPHFAKKRCINHQARSKEFCVKRAL